MESTPGLLPTATTRLQTTMTPVFFVLVIAVFHTTVAYEQLPNFQDLKALYPGYARYGGDHFNHRLIEDIGCDTALLLHDTSALRLSTALNRIGGPHSLGRDLIRLSKYGRDSVEGADGLQYIYHPIAYGPYLADKYGFPNVSKLHEFDPLLTKKSFWGRQGLLRVITYGEHHKQLPKGHVALWDCNHFHQAKDWIAGHSLITVEFWESPDSDCSHMPPGGPSSIPTEQDIPRLLKQAGSADHKPAKSRHHHWEKRLIKKFYQWQKAIDSDAAGERTQSNSEEFGIGTEVKTRAAWT